MAQLRAVWPEVEQALNTGHTLRVVHKRLNAVGIPISYKRLTVYRSRIQREKARGLAVVPAPLPPARKLPYRSPPGFDPIANLREQEQKALNWKYSSGPPDESKLI